MYPPYNAIAIAVAKPLLAASVILLTLILFTARLIVPLVVIGEPVTVNSDEPLSATATLVTVQVNVGVTLEKVILTEPIVPELSVVHK